MRLLSVHTFQLKDFLGDSPPYAILSHTWEEEEVVLSDLSDLHNVASKKGFDKIVKTCEQAKKDHYDYVWIDTCCIDKSSSSELSEAINSMFEWYKKSDKCYAYLADVEDDRSGFKESKWFTRAWTLQELLAPGNSFRKDGNKNDLVGMEFFSKNWKSLGAKTSTNFEDNLCRIISEVTGIAEAYLTGKRPLDSASISMRMSWAAERRATRAEDIAYSLLGIFDVNMPLLYGEGKVKAFRRLQEEIMKISEDETLFAWESSELSAGASSGDALASEPRDFSEARNLVPFATDDSVAPYNPTHRGLRIWLQVHKFPDEVRPLRSPVMIRSSVRLHAAVLRCHAAHDFNHVVVIPLRHMTANLYVRDTSTNVGLLPTRLLADFKPTREIYIRNTRIPSIANSIRRRFGFLIRNTPSWLKIANSWPEGCWNSKDRILQGDRDGQEPRSWHGSLELFAQGDEQAFPSNHKIFLSLGCRQDPSEEEPQASYHLDNVIWGTDEGSLEDFHGSAFSKLSRKRSRDSYTFKYGFELNVAVGKERVFGQRMFVVDIVYAERDHLGGSLKAS